MKRISLIFAAALALAGLSAKAADSLTMADFGHSIKLMVDGYTGSETLENFPVLVRVSEAGIAGFRYEDTSAWNNPHTTTYGYDLAFFAEDGTRLACEIDTWKHNDESLVWVKLPSMAKGTKFWMCYNVSDGVRVENPNPWGDYVGVWHLKETGTKKQIVDASPNAMNGYTVPGGTIADGAVGAGRKIAEDREHAWGIVVDATNGIPQKAVADLLGTDFSASFWMNPLAKGTDCTYGFLVDRRKGEYNNPGGWGIRLHEGKANTQRLQIYAATEKPNNGNYDGFVSAQNYPSLYTASTWTKVDVHWKYETNGNNPAADIYTNGVFVETVTLTSPAIQDNANIGIGGSTQPNPANNTQGKGRRFNGYMDEVRIQAGVPSAERVKADFDTVDNEQFLIGPQTITWDVGTNGGTMDVGGTTVTTSTNTVPLDLVPVAPGTPVKAGAVFVGWSTVPTATTAVDPAESIPRGPMTFYAVFADAVVRWFAADGTTPLDPAATSVAAGSRPAHANPPAPPSTLHDRYVFDGWTRVDGDGSTVYPTAELPIASAGDDISYKAVFSVKHSDEPDPSLLGFSHSAALKVAGYTGSAAVENFPVLVRLSETAVSGFLYSDLASPPSDGADLAFFDAGGNPLAFEIDTWNPSGESLVWVRLPSMQNGTRFTIWWGSSEVTGKAVCADDPWSDYTGVWHMNESGNGTSVVVKDATVNGLDGRPTHSTSAAVADGQIGGARFVTSYQDNSSSYNSGVQVDLSSDATKRAAVDAIVPEFSASMWIRPQNSTLGGQSQFEYLISRRAADKGPGWGAQFDKKSSEYSPLRVYSNEETDKDDDGLGNPADVKVSTGASTGIVYQEWHKVDMAWTADGKYRIFVDGIQTSKDSTSTLVGGPVTNCLAATLPLSLGGSAAPLASGASSGRGFYGDMDEVRLRPGALSADRALADFETVTNRNFLVNDILTITWSNASGTNGFERIGTSSVVVCGAVSIFGLADSCDIEGKIWAAGGVEPAIWTPLTNGVDTLAAFSIPVTGLSIDTTYYYALRAVGNDGENSKTLSGAFSTLPELAVEWSSATASTGLSRIAPDFIIVSGSVSALGEATACDIEVKVWQPGDSEPEYWTSVAEGMKLNDAFNTTIRETAAGVSIAPGTAYNYALRAVGNDGYETVPVTGTFTTKGESGDVIGSDDTIFFDDGTNACWVVKDFERYLPFTVTGYTGTETLTNFPVLVDVRASDTNGFSYADFYHVDGKDIAFVDEKGHIIPHEIDTWNRNGMSLFWVRLPEMVNGTTFTMCYRSPLVNPPADPGNVFEKYVGVWHMNETQDGVVNLKDSTVNDFVTETHAQSLAGINEGQKIGGNCRRVAQEAGTSSSNGRIIVFDHDDILRTGVGNVFTFSGWYKTKDNSPKWAYLVDRKVDDFSRGWGVQFHDNATDQFRVWSDPKGNKNAHEEGKTGGYYVFDVAGYSHQTWAYWTFVFSNDTFHAYLDGEELASTVGGFKLDEPFANDETADYDNLVIGGQQVGTGALNGYVDEARYSKGVRSDDWIKAEYDSTRQKDNSFVTKGATVSRGTDSRVPVVVWERGAGLPDTIIDVSYAYVQFAGMVTYCGAGATECRIEYQLWSDGEEEPTAWTTLLDHATVSQSFSIPVTGLKQDMPYNFRIRAVCEVGGVSYENRERVGSFRTDGNVNEDNDGGELLRIGNKFVHRYRVGSYTFTTPNYVDEVEILVVGGGGAGGYMVGGGGGGLFYSESFPVETNTAYRIQVGQGGVAASNLSARSGNGEISYFARLDIENGVTNETMLIQMLGGGSGGSYTSGAALAKGADGASGGGGTYALAGGFASSNQVDGVWVTYGHEGGIGNDTRQSGNTAGKTAAGGGGGAGRAGTQASFDKWYGGGAGGVGVECAMTGETLFYGAGGGGGYKYTETKDGYTKPGTGGSGIGGDAANLRTGTLATSGVENTGAGGGGGSMALNETTPTAYWQGGDGGDGVVLIAYEVHGRDPISEEPRISMTDCVYTDERGYATIGYRAFWAGIQADTSDIYVLYSTVSEEDVAAGNGEMVKCAEGKIGVGWLTFTPPEKGYTYWVRLVSRKDANSYMFSDEIASFEAPAIRINGVTWTESKATEISAPDTSKDFATVLYDVYDTDPDALLYCYWSENRADLEGNSEPSGEGVHFLNVTDDIIENGADIVHATRFRVSAALGLERNKQYYFRLALANEAGTKFNLSPRIMPLWTAETAYVVYPQAVWANHVVTADFMLSPASYDPASVELLALYSGVLSDITAGNAITKGSVKSINLGTTDQYPHGDQTLTQFPLSSTETTNYFTRLALKLPDGKYVYSARYQEVNITSYIPTNTILITARAIPQKRCYGDEPPAFDYEVTYAGYTNTVAWEHRPSVVGEPACVTIADDPALQEAVTSQSPSGQYRIIQNTLALSNPEPYRHTVTEPVVDPVTGEQVLDPETHEPVTQTVTTEYNFEFAYARARYTITNAVFSAAVEDISETYKGEAFEPSELRTSESGVRNNQAVSYQFRPVAGEWSDVISASYTDVGTHSFEFMATAANHENTYGLFTVKIEPAPLKATIGDVLLNYNGEAQTPEVKTNVTGLVHGEINPLTCVFRDEAGEWQADVPSFTNPGEYTLYFKVSAPNHADFVTNCTVTVKGWDYKVNMDGKSGFGTEIHVSDPGWLLKASGRTGSEFADDATRYGHLDEVCPNGLKLWQNYVIDRTDLRKRLVATVMQRGSRVDKNAFVIHFPGVVALQNTGLNIRYRLDRKLKGESAFTPGALSDKYEMSVPLGFGKNDDSTGLYVFNMVLVPTNTLDTGTAVLASCTTVGVLRVACANPNTVAAVPWKSMSVDTEEVRDIPAGEVVNQNGLSIDDMIVAYNAASKNFSGWTNEGEDGWKGLATVTKNGVSLVDAETAQMPRGNAFWLVRSAPSKYFYLIGRYTGEDYDVELAGGTAKEPGHTLVANPTMRDVDLNDLVFVDGEGDAATPSLDDRIVVLDASGMQTIYFLHKTKKKWGRNVPTKVGRRVQNVWTEDGTNTMGTGFWYLRTDQSTLKIKFGGAQ